MNPKPESETPETDALTNEAINMGGTPWAWSVEERKSFLKKLFDSHERIEHRLSLAQAEIKWLTVQTTRLGKDLVCAQENFHVTNQAYVKADVERTQAQARIAELEKDAARLDAVQARKLTIGISRAGDFFVHADLSGDEATRCPNVRSAIDAALKDRA